MYAGLRAAVLLLGLAAFAATAGAGEAPAAPGRLVYATGQLVAVGPEAQTIEIRQGNREVPFSIDADAEIFRMGKRVRAIDLRDDVGRRVRLRYIPTAIARVVHWLEVLEEAGSSR